MCPLNVYKKPGPNLGISCIWQSDAALMYETHAKIYFDGKQLEKGLNKGS